MTTAVRFDASGDYLRRTSLWDYNSAYTVCFWLYLASNTGSGYQALLTLSAGGSAYDEIFVDGSRVLSLEVGNGSSTKATGATLALSTWYHVAVVRESSGSIKIYLDGSSTPTLTNTQSVSGRTTANNLSFATNAFSEWADCRVAFARAWTAALTTTEIATEMNSETAVKSGAWAVWPLQSNATDTSGNARDLTTGGTLTYSEAGPTISGGSPVTITPTAATGASSAVAPTVVLGALTIAPTKATVASTAVAPTVVLGALTVVPAVATVAATAVAPTVLAGGITITPAAAIAASSAVAPTVVLGALTIAPTAATVASSAVAPTVVAGSAIVPAAATVHATAVAPTIVLGAMTVTPAAASAHTSAIAPTVLITVLISAVLLHARSRNPNLHVRRPLDLTTDRDIDVRYRGG